jgi:serine phosphatase RsbU (regulator of sigma subunit)/catechol 2,3-dioxygenase-like lactoylglutathione lyase family enzyme
MAITSARDWADRSTFRLDSQDLYLRIHCITVLVRDQDRSLQFYRDRLGFDVMFDTRLESAPGGLASKTPTSSRWLGVAPPDGSAFLLLIKPEPGSEEYNNIGRSSNVVLATEDVTAKFQEWSERGVRFRHPPRPQTSGAMFTIFEDPDGNSFVLAGFDDLTRGVEAGRRAVAEKLESERRAAQELDIAKQVQARLFPQDMPSLRTLDYGGICIQARQVGGDYYDFLNLGRERLGLVIGDISGKGIAAALLMANLQANVRQCAIAVNQPELLLRAVNQLFYGNTTDSAYATLFFAEYDDSARAFRYANCGHLPGLILRNDNTVERLDSTATVVGLFKEWDCSIGERRLQPGDMLALYTDGITESFSEAGEEFGEQRLIDALRRHRDFPAQILLDAIVSNVREFSPREQHDDITLVVAKCTGD